MNPRNSLARLQGLSPRTRGGLLAGAGGLASISDFGRNMVLNELLGIDDFRRVAKYAGEGDFGKMLKSLAAGVFELGSTVIPGGQIAKVAKVGKLANLAKAADAGVDLSKVLKPRPLRNFQQFGGDIIKASPIGGRVLSRVPRATTLVDGVRTLTPGGRLGLNAFRAYEIGAMADAANAVGMGMGLPALPYGTAAQVQRDQVAEQMRRRALQSMSRQQFNPLDTLFTGGY